MSVVASLNSHLIHLKKAAQACPSTDNVLEITKGSVEGSNPRITNKNLENTIYAIDESRNS